MPHVKHFIGEQGIYIHQLQPALGGDARAPTLRQGQELAQAAIAGDVCVFGFHQAQKLVIALGGEQPAVEPIYRGDAPHQREVGRNRLFELFGNQHIA